MKCKNLFLTTCLMLSSGFAHAQAYGNQPSGSVIQGDLEWLRCAVGQSWTGTTCAGTAPEFTFQQAQETAPRFNATGYDGKRDWRVPTNRELQSIRLCTTGFVETKRELKDGLEPVPAFCNEGHAIPTIDSNQFPNTNSHDYWSSSISIDDTATELAKLLKLDVPYGRFVDFSRGIVNSYHMDWKGAVRLVRSVK